MHTPEVFHRDLVPIDFLPIPLSQQGICDELNGSYPLVQSPHPVAYSPQARVDLACRTCDCGELIHWGLRESSRPVAEAPLKAA